MRAAILYIVAVLAANLTATAFLPLPVWPGSEILISVGTLIFGVTFTQRDRMHTRGRPFVYSVIVFTAFLNLAMLLSFRFYWGGPLAAWFTERDYLWLAQSAEMLRDSGWRVFLASFVAMLIAESADTEVYHQFSGKTWFGRVLRSNAVSIPVDSVVFNLIAFAGGMHFPMLILVKIMVGEIVSKYLVGFLYAWFYPWHQSTESADTRGKAV